MYFGFLHFIVNNAFMKKVMTRIASQLGITLDSGCTIEGI